MKQLLALISLVLIAAALFIPVRHTAAVDVLNDTCASNPTSTLCQGNKPQTVEDNGIFGKNGILKKATSLVLILVGIASVIMIIVGGFKYVLSNGDSNAINSAKNTIIYAVVGLVVAVVAQAIIVFVIGRL